MIDVFPLTLTKVWPKPNWNNWTTVKSLLSHKGHLLQYLQLTYSVTLNNMGLKRQLQYCTGKISSVHIAVYVKHMQQTSGDLHTLQHSETLRNGLEHWGYVPFEIQAVSSLQCLSHTHIHVHKCTLGICLFSSILTHAYMHVHRHAHKVHTFWIGVLKWSAPQTTDLHWFLYSYSLHLSWIRPLSSLPSWGFVLCCLPSLSAALVLLVHLSLDLSFLPSPQSLSILSLSSVLSPLLGIGGSISFKAHVKGTVCRFQRPLCPAFLPLNLVSPKHFPIAWPSRPLFPQLPLSSHLSLPLTLPTVLNTFCRRWYV